MNANLLKWRRQKRRELYDAATAELLDHAARYRNEITSRLNETKGDVIRRNERAFQKFQQAVRARAGYPAAGLDWVWIAIGAARLLLEIWRLWKDKKDTRAAL